MKISQDAWHRIRLCTSSIISSTSFSIDFAMNTRFCRNLWLDDQTVIRKNMTLQPFSILNIIKHYAYHCHTRRMITLEHWRARQADTKVLTRRKFKWTLPKQISKTWMQSKIIIIKTVHELNWIFICSDITGKQVPLPFLSRP